MKYKVMDETDTVSITNISRYLFNTYIRLFCRLLGGVSSADAYLYRTRFRIIGVAENLLKISDFLVPYLVLFPSL